MGRGRGSEKEEENPISHIFLSISRCPYFFPFTPATQATHIFLSVSRCPYFFPVYACYTGYPHFSLTLAVPSSSLFTPATQATHISLSISRCPYFFPVYACYTGYPIFHHDSRQPTPYADLVFQSRRFGFLFTFT